MPCSGRQAGGHREAHRQRDGDHGHDQAGGEVARGRSDARLPFIRSFVAAVDRIQIDTSAAPAGGRRPVAGVLHGGRHGWCIAFSHTGRSRTPEQHGLPPAQGASPDFAVGVVLPAPAFKLAVNSQASMRPTRFR